MNQYIKIFRDFIPKDKGRIKELIPRFFNEIQLLGKHIEKKTEKLYAISTESIEEFIDFIDGNGFIIERKTDTSPFHFFSWETATIIPIYPEEIEDNEEEEKHEPVIRMELPVQTCSLSYTSMEMDEGPVLECEELYTPRPIWICLRRCLEFLRLVSAGWGGSSTLPRPP